MNQTHRTDTLNEIITRLVARFDPEEIILFGSHARGTAHSDSDIDLLVVLPIEGSHRAKQIEMRVALHDLQIPTDIIVATPEQVSQQRNIVGTLIRPALAEGKRLYVRNGSSSARRSSVGATSGKRSYKRRTHAQVG